MRDALRTALLGTKKTVWQSNGTWTIADGRTFENNPNLGAELVVNGNMETGSPPSSYTTVQVTLAADVDAHGGSQALRVTSTEGTSDRAEQVITAAVGLWLQMSGWAKRGTGTQQVFNLGNTTAPIIPVATTSYAQYFLTGRVTSANPIVRLYANQNTGAAGDYGIYDDVSVKALTLNELFVITTGPADFNRVVGRIAYHGATAVCGVVASLDSISSPANFVIGFHDGNTTATLMKCVAGTYTSLLTATTPYTAGEQIEIRKTTNTTYQLWYKGAQRGADQTVSDAGIKDNVLHGGFNPSVLNGLTGLGIIYGY